MSQRTKTIAILTGILGVVLFSAKAVMVKMAYQYEIAAVPLLLLRMLFSLPFYAVIALLNKPVHPDKIRRRDYTWVVVFGMMGYFAASYFDFLGLQYIQASLERIILFLYPTIVLLLSRWFLKEKMLPSIYFDLMLKGNETLAKPQILSHAPMRHEAQDACQTGK